MNIKKLIVPIGSLIVVIAALIIGVVIINNPASKNTQDANTSKLPQQTSSLEVQTQEADAAYRRGDYTVAITTLEKVRNAYQDQNKKQEADEINDKIESIKALQKQQQPNENANKTPAPIAE